MNRKLLTVIALCGFFNLVAGVTSGELQPAQAQALRSSKVQQIAQRQRQGVLTTASNTDTRINLRSEPSERSRISGYGVAGDRVEILNESRNRDGDWLEIRSPRNERGWVPAKLVQVSDTGSTNQPLNISQAGSGQFTLAGRRDQGITSAALTVDARGNADLALRLSDRSLIRLDGRVTTRNASSVSINLTNSGNADASGTANITLGANNSIARISVQGRLDGQNLSASFTGDNVSGRPDGNSGQSLNLSQTGRGQFTVTGRPAREITSVSVSVNSQGNANLALRLSDRSLIRFDGREIARDAYSLTIDLTNSGNADATGTANIEYGANNLITRVFADGRLDGQNFSINFAGDSTSGRSNRQNSDEVERDLAGQNLVGQNVDEVISRLRRDSWQVAESSRSTVKLDRGQIGMDIEFDPRTRRIIAVRTADLF